MAIDRALAMGKYPELIARELRGLDWAVKAHTISKHRDHWLAKLPTTERDLMKRLEGSYHAKADLAELVRDDVRRRVEDGELRPTVQQGLAAQAMLDRREERAQDRELALGLARLLSGSSTAAPARVIDGDARAVERLAEGRRPDRIPEPVRQNRYRTTEPAP